LFGRIPFAVPFFSAREILSTFEPSEFSRFPRCGANRVFDFIQSKTAFARVSLRVIGQTDRFHTPIKKAATTNCKDFSGRRQPLQIAADTAAAAEDVPAASRRNAGEGAAGLSNQQAGSLCSPIISRWRDV
jgi:hypothetical protein